jgi:hypothetical protein
MKKLLPYLFAVSVVQISGVSINRTSFNHNDVQSRHMRVEPLQFNRMDFSESNATTRLRRASLILVRVLLKTANAPAILSIRAKAVSMKGCPTCACSLKSRSTVTSTLTPTNPKFPPNHPPDRS